MISTQKEYVQILVNGCKECKGLERFDDYILSEGGQEFHQGH
jgi:hypothetical protein